MRKKSKIAALFLALCFLIGCNSAPELAVVPDVTEADATAAVALLTQQGFVPVVKETADPTAPIGTVLRIDPPAGSYVAVGGKVYLFVAADTAATVPPTATAAPTATTTTPQTATSTPHLSPSAPPTTTTTAKATTAATVADFCAAGHRYADGVCTTCGKTDPLFVPTLSLGQTWTVENQWSFTLLGVEAHHLCNPVHNAAANFENRRIVTIRYAYENLGFVSESELFLFDATTFAVTQEDGAHAPSYGCLHEKKAIPCAVGEFHTAEETYAVDETCRRVTLLVTLRTADKQTVQRVRYLLDLP